MPELNNQVGHEGRAAQVPEDRRKKKRARPPGLGASWNENRDEAGRQVQAVGRTSLALFTSTNPHGKLFTDLKPIPGTGTTPGPGQQAGRQAGRGWTGYHLTASCPTLALLRAPGTGGNSGTSSQEALLCLQLLPLGLMALPWPEPLGLTVPENGHQAPQMEGVEHQGALGVFPAPSPALHSAAPAPPDPATQSPQW